MQEWEEALRGERERKERVLGSTLLVLGGTVVEQGSRRGVIHTYG